MQSKQMTVQTIKVSFLFFDVCLAVSLKMLSFLATLIPPSVLMCKMIIQGSGVLLFFKYVTLNDIYVKIADEGREN